MSCTSHVTDQLHQRGFRVTAQRLAVLDALHHGGHLSPGEVYARVRADLPGLTEATVYRALEFLAQEKFILAGRGPDGRLRYELTADEHHHLVCRECGMAVDIGQEPLQALVGRLETETRFQIDLRHLTFSGLCPACQKER